MAVEHVEERPPQHHQCARPHSGDIRDPNGQYGDEDFLIVGIDSRLGENADMGAGDADDADGHARTQ